MTTQVSADLQAGLDELKAAAHSEPRDGRDPVNQPMIHHWVDAIGDKNPIYVDEEAAKAAGHPGIVAPPAMIQVWTMGGLGQGRAEDDPLSRAMQLFDYAGYVGVVATNCEQTYHRYLRPGEQLTVHAEITDVVGPKQTALGEGYFINQLITWTVAGGETVAEMNWRIMKFRPREKDAAEQPSAIPEDLDPDKLMRPASSRDTRFFWRASTRTSCASSAAPTAACSTRRCRRCGRTTGTRSPRRTMSWPPVRGRFSVTSCTMRRRCPGAVCRS